ncbi:MAG: hypothetical protein IPN68_06815 [Bacteroidetes bacterium]|nr:hypothetical protein [Bacteroidota bacterium]
MVFIRRIVSGILLFLTLLFFIAGCAIFNKSDSSGSGDESQLVTTRRFAGLYIDYRATVTEELPKVEVIWIKTSLESRYGKICAFGKKCEFSKGDRLYLTKKFFSPGMVGGRWEYYIENDSSVLYQLIEYQSDRKVMSESWFQ